MEECSNNMERLLTISLSHHQRDGSFDGVFCEKCLIISQMIVERIQGPHFFNSSYFSFCSLSRNQP